VTNFSRQAQAGWLQHDLGHLSVFKSRELNLFAHRFVIIHLKAASSAWWNYRHYLHHAKPNIAEADPGHPPPPLAPLLGRAVPTRCQSCTRIESNGVC
jgi:fatty acid desaturase 1 (delta-5 desaturase)